MGIWDAVKNISNKIASDIGFKKTEFVVPENINKPVEDEYGILGTPKRKIWVFNSGNNFSGNPKWMFVYINKYRPDIKAFWLCSDENTVDYINSLGYKAFLYSSKEGLEIAAASGVYVVEQCKEVIPPELRDCVYLNLFHGVGCKTIERNLKDGVLLKRVMKKYVVNNTVYSNNQLFLVTSPLMEDHFKTDVGLTDDMIVRGGYPRCIYQKYYDKIETFNHNILERKNRSSNTKIIVYSPTFRENANYDLMSNAIPDIKRLENKLKENNLLFVFKMHPIMSANDSNYKRIKELYEDSPYFLFWDNNEDIYEIFDRIDLAIIDYSSIFYDFLAGGVKNFVRYFFDYDVSGNVREGAYDYKEMTCGKICSSFEDLLSALDNFTADEAQEKERQRIYDLFWQYSEKDTMDRIIDAALSFKVKTEPLPSLYSFDVFDTLISRKGLSPSSIFCFVKEQMEKSSLGFERHFINSYIDIRRRCEANVRELKNKTTYVRNSDYSEISFDSIFDRMANLYSLTAEQVAFLKETELEAELNDCIPINEMISYAETLIDRGEDVLLISDMYLPSAFIRKMLGKFSQKLIRIPMYVSCEYGVQKASGLLFQEVYKDLEFYKYGKWIHHGDNPKSDKKMPSTYGISPVRHVATTFNTYENSLIEKLGTYDSYLVAALMARFRERNKSVVDYFSYAYASLCLVPYTMWVLDDAQKRGIDTLYFISRDGYHPKRIADAVINKLSLNIKAKYIYGSRKAWRIPSFVNEFDESFFLPFGNLASATSFEEVLSALVINEEQFESMFPALCDLDIQNIITKEQMSVIISVVKASDEYRKYLLNLAAKERVSVEKYLKQEVNFDEKFAFVDYWGRGYTQTCLTRLLHNIKHDEFDVPYYYVRSIYPSEGHNVRYNYTCKNTSMLFVEALFSNIDYKSIYSYCENNEGKMVPVIEKDDCNTELLNSMRTRLFSFACDFLDLDLTDKASTLRSLLDFSLEYFNSNQSDPVIVENLASLRYSVTMFGTKRDYAPALTKEEVELLAEKKVILAHMTNSLEMSLARTDSEIVDYYNYLTGERKKELSLENKTITQAKKQTVKDYQSKKYIYDFDKRTKKERSAYNKAAKNDVENKIVIINIYENGESEFSSLISTYESNGYSVEILPLLGNYSGDMLKSIATAKYIFMSNVSGWFSRVRFREETKLIQFFKEPIPLSGLSQLINENTTDAKADHIRRIHKVVYSLIPCTGEGVKELLHEHFVRKENCKYTELLGNPITDVYFSEEAKEGIRTKLSETVEQNGKKLMVYLPQSTGARRHSYSYLDLAAMQRLYSDEYNLLVVSNKPDDVISVYTDTFQGFAYNGNGIVTQREAMAVADVIIGDCTSVLLEGVLTGKPLFFTSKYVPKEDGTSLFTEEEILIAPIIDDAYSLVTHLNGEVEYNFEKINAFKEKYFGACDGKSAEKIFRFLEQEEK